MKDAKSAHPPRILVVDDDAIVLGSLAEFLRLEGYEVAACSSVAAALDLLREGPFNLVISDVNLPQSDGFELLRTVRTHWPEVVTILITGYGTIESAVDAIKLGAYDYLTKPIIDEEVKLTVERALNQQALIAENRTLREQLEQRHGLANVIGQDYKMSRIFEVIDSVVDSRITVLVSGESGTGKSMIARALHQSGPRCSRPFIEVSCGAIPETLLESELFGHVKGSFTGALADKVGKFKAADGGTLFLDEIAVASPGLQLKLLRALQERQFEPVGSNATCTVDARVILATNVDLEAEVAAGRFRQDLYYRINVVNIVLPPLRERIGDIPALARHFLKKFAAEAGKDLGGFEPEAIQAMQGYPWPGNVRELENAVERATVFCKGRLIQLTDLPPRIVDHTQRSSISLASNHDSAPTGRPLSLAEALEEPERRIIEHALRSNNWNRQLTADALQINRTTLYKKMKRYGLFSHEHACSA